MSKSISLFARRAAFILLLLTSSLMAISCQPAGEAEDPTNLPTEQPAPTVVPQATDAPTAEPATEPDGYELDGIPVGFTQDGHAYRGSLEAPIVLEEFSDFECPFCADFHTDTLPSLLNNEVARGDVVLIFYDYPLSSIHKGAIPAANAARCAGAEGPVEFWQMHDLLFERVDDWATGDSAAIFKDYAAELDLPAGSFAECVDSQSFEASILVDYRLGQASGVSSTPSFLLNSQLFVGAQPYENFFAAFDIIKQNELLAANREGREPLPPGVAPTRAPIESDYAATLGDPDAPVKIVEFTDYQCPYCARHGLDTLPQIDAQLVKSGLVFYALKDLPLASIHPEATLAAVAARCAGEQGSYWEMHDSLYQSQIAWSDANSEATQLFTSLAADLLLDTAAFDSCLVSGKFDAAIAANVAEASQLGVSITPFFFVDGYPLDGARPFEHFQIATQLAEEGALGDAFVAAQQPDKPLEAADIPIDEAYSYGAADAPITIVEYSDYECPFCLRYFSLTLPELVQKYVDTGIVRYVFKDFPLTNLHQQAFGAAEAARCAGEQDSYFEMHDLIFSNQNDWAGNEAASAIFHGYANGLGLDLAEFSSCMSTHKYADAIQADIDEGISLGVTGTPAFFLNGNFLAGAQPIAVFDEAIATLQAAGQ